MSEWKRPENKIEITGKLVRDSESKATSKGSITMFTIAYNHTKETASFFDVTAFKEYDLRKGQLVTVKGFLKQESWEKDGKKNSRIKIIATSIDTGEQSESRQEPEQQEEPREVF